MRVTEIRVSRLLVLCCYLSLAVGCQEQTEPIIIESNDEGNQQKDVYPSEEDGNQADATDGNDDNDIGQNNSRHQQYEQCLADEVFEKPQLDDAWEPHRFHTEDDFSYPGDSGLSIRGANREHMVNPWGSDENWLYEDEYFVIDRTWLVYSDVREDFLYEYEMFVVHEGKRLPMRVVYIEEEEGFPSLEEIESWDEDEFSYSSSFELTDRDPINFTLVIPPWAFDEEGTYYLQILPLRQWEFGEDGRGARGYGSSSSLPEPATIYYASECERPSTGDVSNREEDVVDPWDHDEIGKFVGWNEGLFLAPPTDIYDWTEIPDWAGDPDYDWDGEVEFDQVFESPEQTVTLHLYAVDGVPDRVPRSEETLYYLFRDDEVIDQFLVGEGVVPQRDFISILEGEEPGVMFPIDVELTEEPANYRVVAITHPFEPIVGIDEFYVPQPTQALQMKYSSE